MTLEDFKEEVLPLKQKIFRLAKRMLGAVVEAEDAMQDVMVKLWTRREKLSEYRSVEAFAMTVTKNLCLDKLKSHSRKVVDLDLPTIHPNDTTTDRMTEAREGVLLMNQIIDRLPEQQKLIVQLREIEGYEFKEIEDITGMQMNAIRVNLSRARQKIREELTKAYNYGLTID